MHSAHSPTVTASSSLLQRIHVLRSLPEPFDKAALTTQSTARPSSKINGYVGSLTILPSDLSESLGLVTDMIRARGHRLVPSGMEVTTEVAA